MFVKFWRLASASRRVFSIFSDKSLRFTRFTSNVGNISNGRFSFSVFIDMPLKRKVAAKPVEPSNGDAKAKKTRGNKKVEEEVPEDVPVRSTRIRSKRGAPAEVPENATSDNEETQPKANKKSKPKAATKTKAQSKNTDAEQLSDDDTKSEDKKSEPKRGKVAEEPEKTSDVEEEDEKPKTKPKRGKVAEEPEKTSDVEEEDEKPKTKPKRGAKNRQAEPQSSEVLLNPTETDYKNIDFTCANKSSSGKAHNIRIGSWNVDGLRAWVKKGGLKYLDHEKPDIFCIQETKCSTDKLPEEVADVKEYKQFWTSGDKEGYAGVGLWSKIDPLNVQYGIDDDEQEEGRCVTAEFEKFYVVSVYVPNAGRKLVTLPKRLEWNESFKAYIDGLNAKKPVIIAGDMNVAHSEIDLKNPKTNTKNAGFTQEERDGFTDMLSEGYVDTYRKLNPDKTDVYTFWTYMSKCRSKNVGWRLDYFIVSKRLFENVCDSVVRSDVLGSDHCPITLFLNV